MRVVDETGEGRTTNGQAVGKDGAVRVAAEPRESRRARLEDRAVSRAQIRLDARWSVRAQVAISRQSDDRSPGWCVETPFAVFIGVEILASVVQTILGP